MDMTEAFEARDAGGVVPVRRRLGADTLGNRRPIGGHLGVSGQTVHAASLTDDACCANHHLRGQACPVGAFAADERRLDADHVESGLQQP